MYCRATPISTEEKEMARTLLILGVIVFLAGEYLRKGLQPPEALGMLPGIVIVVGVFLLAAGVAVWWLLRSTKIRTIPE